MTALHRDATGALAGLIAEINDILVEKAGLDVAEVVADGSATLEELGLDSLAGMELQAVLESRHGVDVGEDAVHLSVGHLATLVRTQTSTAT